MLSTISLLQAAPESVSIAAVDTYVKIGTGVVMGVAALLGFPIIRLTYKKTNAEIAKLELEAAALRRASADTSSAVHQHSEGSVRVSIDDSPNARVQVTADPRFLAPLLLLLDFIISWVILALVGHVLSLVPLYFLQPVVHAVLAFVLLIPLVQQALHVKAVLQPPRSPQDFEAAVKPIEFAILTFLYLFAASAVGFGIVLISVEGAAVGRGEWLLVLGSLVLGIGIAAATPLVKTTVRRFFERLYGSLPPTV